jgi:hypothetical protein
VARVIGEERVATLERGAELFVALARDGPMALWQRLEGWIGNLADSVISTVRTWIRDRIVAAAVRTLAPLLTPAGALVRAVMTVYDTVVFFIQEARRIGALVEAAVDSLERIASGRLQQAADAIEGAMARTIPVLLSFLARLVGLGDVGTKLKQAIGQVRDRVDTAIGRLVDWVVARARALLQRARDTAGAIVEWWRQRTGFRVGGEEHTLSFGGERTEPTILVASRAQDVATWLEANRPEGDAGELARLYGEAHRQHGQVLRAARAADSPTVAAELQALGTKLAAFMTALRTHEGVTPSVITPETTLHEDELGTGVTASPLTIHGPGGSAPSLETPIWQTVRQRRHGGGSYYVRGHLLNEQLHGPGNERWNLTPLTRGANATHETEAESIVKDHVWNRGGANPQGRPVRYEVRAIYGRDASTVSALEAKIEEATYSPMVKQQMVEIVRAEQHVPTHLSITAVTLEPGQDAQLHAGDPLPRLSARIDNPVPATVPDLEGAVPRRRLVLTELLEAAGPSGDAGGAGWRLSAVGRSRLSGIEGLGGTEVEAIGAALADRAPDPFRSFIALGEAARGTRSGVAADLVDRLRNAPRDDVKLYAGATTRRNG